MAKNLRFWEIDSLRGIAVVMMVVFHLLFDLSYFGGFWVNVDSGFWLYFARATAAIFIFLVGVSLTISYSRAYAKYKTEKGLFMKYLKRGLKIFSWGLVITLITWIFFRGEFIIFGVLHFIGISIILAYPLIKYRYRNLFLGIILVALGLYLRNFTFDFSWLMWLGFVPKSFYTFDYFPILPWFGVVLIGLFFGNLLYEKSKRKFKLSDLSRSVSARFSGFLGRHSLFIYLIHQPAIILILYFLGIAKI